MYLYIYKHITHIHALVLFLPLSCLLREKSRARRAEV